MSEPIREMTRRRVFQLDSQLRFAFRPSVPASNRLKRLFAVTTRVAKAGGLGGLLARIPVVNVTFAIVVILVALPWLTCLAVTWLRYGMLRVPKVIVAVGNDGIRLHGAMGKAFVPFGQIRSLRYASEGLLLDLENGEQMAVQPNRAVDRWDKADHAPLLEAFRCAQDAWKVHEASLAQASTNPWRSELARSDGDSYRTQSVPVDQLWALARNPAAQLDVRLLASKQLIAREEGSWRPRVESLAESSADEEFMVALARMIKAGNWPKRSEPTAKQVSS